MREIRNSQDSRTVGGPLGEHLNAAVRPSPDANLHVARAVGRVAPPLREEAGIRELSAEDAAQALLFGGEVLKGAEHIWPDMLVRIVETCGQDDDLRVHHL